jgi:hypothetical protein
VIHVGGLFLSITSTELKRCAFKERSSLFPAIIVTQDKSAFSNTFEQNIIYRFQSTQSKGKDPNVLDSNWALVHITIPAILGKLGALPDHLCNINILVYAWMV